MVLTSLTVALPYSVALIEKQTKVSIVNLKNIIEHPETVKAAANRLQVILTDAELNKIKSMPKDDLILLHFSFGKDIRNAFGLNGENTALLGNRCADDVAMDIVEELWEKLSVK